MEIFDLGVTSVAAITIICYLLCAAVRVTPLDNKWIPTIAGILGGALGVPAMFIMESFPATDYITAVAIGIVSGLAATGINQVYKQLSEN